MKIGQKIRDAREDLDLTQTNVSEQIPMNQSSYSKIERDILQPSLEQLKRICEILHLDANDLLNIFGEQKFKPNAVKYQSFGKEVKKLYEKTFLGK